MVGIISSIATLILFVIYFIGRIITIKMEKHIYYDKITFEAPEDVYGKYDIIDEINTVNNSEGEATYQTVVVLTSLQGIRDITVYELAYDNMMNEQKEHKKVIASQDFLNIGQSYAIRTIIPEIFPNYRIEYRTQDKRKVTFNITDNLKNGVLSEMVEIRHTLCSYIYYLFR